MSNTVVSLMWARNAHTATMTVSFLLAGAAGRIRQLNESESLSEETHGNGHPTRITVTVEIEPRSLYP